jgi:GNAT superfamily N-acetyltransferase
MMDIQVTSAIHEEIKELRTSFLNENNCQFIHNKCHDYGWADVYLFTINGTVAGYGSVWGRSRREDRDTFFEFYIDPAWRSFAEKIFRKFQEACAAIYMESQTNDQCTCPMLYEFAKNINAEAILFEDHFESSLHIPGTVFRKKTPADQLPEGTGDYLMLYQDNPVADGGLMLNYNIPYADIYMKVKEGFRGNGFGSLVVQELKKEAYKIGRVPAARCNIKNFVSKATLQKAGFKVCGFLLNADLLAMG